MPKPRKPELEVFSKNFEYHFKKWKQKSPSNNQEKFARLAYTNRKSVSEWMNAQSKPSEEHIQSICEILEITEDMLFASTVEDKFLYDENFTRMLHEGFQQFNAAIGLDENFLRFIRAAIPDSEFPLWKEVYLPIDPVHIPKYTHKEPMEAFYTDERNYYQFTMDDGRTVNLLYPDFAFLKDVQTEVIRYVEYLYYKRRQEMEKELQYFNDRYVTGTSAVGVGREARYSQTKYSEYMLSEKQKEVMKNSSASAK